MVFVMLQINSNAMYVPNTEFTSLDDLYCMAYELVLDENVDFVIDKRLKPMV